MGEVTHGRAAAAAILRAVSRGRRLDLAFAETAADLPDRDRRWVQEASYGTVRLRGRLDYLLNLHLRSGLNSLSPALLDLLRLGAYQLLHMDGVPPYAAISQTVDQVKGLAGQGGSRLANGVLRSLGREGGEISRFPPLHSDPEAHLSTWGSHPSWMVSRWLQRWSPEEVLQLVEWNNAPAPLYLRPLNSTLEEARALLSDQGWDSHLVGPGIPCLQLDHGTNPAQILGAVPGIIQDPGAALVTVYADVPPEGLVGDLCAAPGGKALAMAGGGAYVLAADRSLNRLRLLKENLARVGGRVHLVAALAQAPPFRELPYLLLDVPCSGTGTLRRHPDARWRLTLKTLNRLTQIQREMLDVGSRLVPKGGFLVYSTCTLEPEENRGQVEAFLSRNPDFSVEESGIVPREYLDEQGYLSVIPQAAGFDGAFGARLVRGS
jgi:16S rRNA (cytosine967-C5)-methyltransferase